MLVSLELEKVGIPSVAIITRPFADACRGIAKIGGIPDLKFAVVPHPIGSLTKDELMERAKSAADQVIGITTGSL